ncbi:type II toxin-antitoxin system RelE/ParE family toxin [Endozoicomonas sp. ONNA1]|uniref:type II toxin-antitoxin system RelE/ParE family toxin n=1 Tax=Endozoicomonas sp. ONNA1 TaxID=2828740 RepID=UPI0021476CB7|nr:type II toxin-antitoxin system RelE/ParE family toxin [Endozoicomonas sp. ONNA1]
MSKPEPSGATESPSYTVHLTRWAQQDLQDISRFLLQKTGQQQVLTWLDELQNAISTLNTMPERGHWVPEMLAAGMKTHRELSHPPYRIIYQIREQSVFVFTVIDSRRDLQSLLKKRLLE